MRFGLRILTDPSQGPYWIDASGKVWRIAKLTDEHIQNIKNYFNRKGKEYNRARLMQLDWVEAERLRRIANKIEGD